MTNFLKTTSVEKDENWYELIEMLFAEESDVEDIAYAASWLSLNFSVLDEKVRNTLIRCLNQPGEFQPIPILETIEYLFDEDRETEIMLLIQLLQYAPDAYKQIEYILRDPELSSSYRNAYMLMIDIDDEVSMLDDEAWSDPLD